MNYEALTSTVDIVTAFVSNNSTKPEELPALISSVYAAIEQATAPKEIEVSPLPEPAVPIKKSVTADHIVCLEDGKKLKMLKRHLMTHYNMTPEQYRARWNLPADYPMTAPNYTEKRRVLAKQIGLGRKAG